MAIKYPLIIAREEKDCWIFRDSINQEFLIDKELKNYRHIRYMLSRLSKDAVVIKPGDTLPIDTPFTGGKS